MRYPIIFLAIALLVTVFPPCITATDYARESRRAQKLLSEGKYDKAYQMYSELATEQKNPLAQFTLALFYEYGWGRTPDRQQACRWYGQAAQRDIPTAAHFYAACFEEGIGVDQSLSDAIYWYEQAVALGHGGSHFPAAQLLLTADNVADKTKGLQHLHQAASIGNQQAQLQLGNMYMQGRQVETNPYQALHWYRQAAQQDNHEAQYLLGILLRDSQSADLHSDEEALKWLETAAANGYQPAYLPTARYYLGGEDLKKDEHIPAPALAKAYMWLSAAEQRAATEEEKATCRKLLGQVSATMPETWKPELDAEVKKHLKKIAVIQQ
ncbi:tetratricopeptide repeat protein [Desulfogranum marinum]|uniref:tetratricopeptide repeat protein n=1 Tax=Desulfogranum marinum TaxID=453220 RepID=UPI0029C946B3|nr:tetratricopeptide repeat protein [Desulfogranum marinum]